MTVYEGNIKPSSIEQATLETDLSAVRVTEISSNQQTRIVYDGSGNPIYLGYAPRGLATTYPAWLLKKITWTDSNPTLIQIAYDSWSNYLTASYS
jgi:hypothetical protein